MGRHVGYNIKRTKWLTGWFPNKWIWDCHRTADQARGGARGSGWGGSPMAVP